MGQIINITKHLLVIWRVDQVHSPPPSVLGEAEDIGEGGRVLQCTLMRRERGDPGRTTVTYHFKCAGRRGGSSLGIPDGGGTGRTGGRQEQL